MGKGTASKRPATGKVLPVGKPRGATIARQASGGRTGAQIRAQGSRWFTPDKQRIFLETFALTSNQRASAEAAGVSPQTVWRLCRRNAAFRTAFEEARARGVDDLEMQVLAQLRFGVTSEIETIVDDSGRRRTVRRSDAPGLAMRLIAMHRADAAATRAVRDAGALPLPPIDHEELAARMRAALKVIAEQRAEAERAIAAQMAPDAAGEPASDAQSDSQRDDDGSGGGGDAA